MHGDVSSAPTNERPMALLQVTRQQLEAETQLGIFRARVKICNPMLRSFMCLREGDEVHHQVQVSGWSG